uniref:Uncharacterized protein n=1 Tax=Ignisphaera aggregans TaxID=334771 RepID=A0A7C2VM51_9CREN
MARYNLIITANNMTLKIGQQTLSYVEYVRIKIYGFKPSADQQGVLRLGNSWVARPSQDVASFTFVNVGLTLSGTAERVEIYKRDLVDGGTGYDPYIMLLNTDGGQGLAGILFTTIDRTYGSSSSINEGSDSLLDYSVKPIALAYKGYNISNTNHSAVVIAINYRFHDNEGSDAGGTTVDKPIMFVGLVDESGRIYSYRSFTFRELTRYEDTYPPTAQAQSSLVFIPLPPPEVGKKTFYLFVAFQDPYSYSGFLDDLDFTLFIESLSLIPID